MITKKMSVAEIIKTEPRSRQLIQKYGIVFIGKDISPLESLEKVGKGNNLTEEDIDNMVKEMNNFKEENVDMKNLLIITDSAASKLKDHIKQKNAKGIRLRLVSSGCSIYSYDMDFGTKAMRNEEKLKFNGVEFYIQKKFASLLNGTRIDFIQSKGGFVFENPNVKE